MQQYIWKNGKMLPWEEATTHVLTHGLHYGTAVFEGIRFYKTAKGPAIFKLPEHVERLYYSASALGMEIDYTPEEMTQAIVETVAKNQIEEGYIRPLIYYGHGPLRVMPGDDVPVDAIIATWPWGAYLPLEGIDMQVSKYIRVHPDSSTVDAKISGHYINSMQASLAIKNLHYNDALLLDADGYVAEGSANNVFIVKDQILKTTPPGTILKGITRDTIIELAKSEGLSVVEEKFTVDEMLEADEAFVCGTAAEVTSLRSLNDKPIGASPGPVTQKMRELYMQAVRGELEALTYGLTYINK